MLQDVVGHLGLDAGLLVARRRKTLADVDESFVGYIQPAMLGIKAMKELASRRRPTSSAPATGLAEPRRPGRRRPRAEVAMALCFDKFTDMTRTGGRARSHQIDALILPAALALGPAPHARPHHPGAVGDQRGELEPRGFPGPRGPTTGSRGARRPDGGRAAHHDDVLPARRGAACVILARDPVQA
jgi:hypothetical protein